MIHTYQSLLEKYQNYGNPKTKIQRMVNNKQLVKLTKGLYEDNKDVDPFFLASVIYWPSYISFESALSFYGLIPEKAYNITCATFDKNKTKKYVTPIGTYIYQDVNKDAFQYGTQTIRKGDYCYCLASKEKALLDTLSKEKPLLNRNALKEYLLNDLRINEIGLVQFDTNTVLQLATHYRSKNVKLFAKALLKGELND